MPNGTEKTAKYVNQSNNQAFTSETYQVVQTLSLGCHIHNGTYLPLSLTLTTTLTLLTLTITVRVTLTSPTLLTLILGTVVNMAP